MGEEKFCAPRAGLVGPFLCAVRLKAGRYSSAARLRRRPLQKRKTHRQECLCYLRGDRRLQSGGGLLGLELLKGGAVVDVEALAEKGAGRLVEDGKGGKGEAGGADAGVRVCRALRQAQGRLYGAGNSRYQVSQP